MKSFDYCAAFAPAPDRFTRRLEHTLNHLEERKTRRISLHAALIAAVVLVLAAGAALALTNRWSIWVSLPNP